jgi:hypothetical protein
MNQIGHLLIMRLADSLEYAMKTSIPSSDITKATLVQPYRFQGSPLENYIYLYVTGGDMNDPNLADSRVSSQREGVDNLDMTLPAGEIGGGHYWWRRGRVVLGCYFVLDPKFAQEVAGQHAHTVLGRAMYTIDSTNVADLVDDFGEQAYMIACYANTFYEGGGPPNQYIWRGEIHWQALTRRPL